MTAAVFIVPLIKIMVVVAQKISLALTSFATAKRINKAVGFKYNNSSQTNDYSGE